ncbi:MAG: HDOD domain-containing protein [Acidimicrobiia bacterium]|nr:HDOD domain-containing protein [Acidimicrobiia bacterium]
MSTNGNSEGKPAFLKQLPPLPQIALKVLQLLRYEDSETKSLVELLQSDPAFSAELLRYANSPLFGLVNEVKTMRSTVVILGRERLRAVTMTVAMNSLLSSPVKSSIFQRVWQHSLATAMLTRGLAAVCDDHSPEEAYTAGLLHDVGKFAFLTLKPKEYPELLRTEWATPLNCLEKEQAVFGLDHCQAGRWMLEEWKLPPEMVDAALCHHDEPVAMPFSAVKLVNLGCRLATALGFDTLKTRCDMDVEGVTSQLPEEYATGFHPDAELIKEAISSKLLAVTQS